MGEVALVLGLRECPSSVVDGVMVTKRTDLRRVRVQRGLSILSREARVVDATGTEASLVRPGKSFFACWCKLSGQVRSEVGKEKEKEEQRVELHCMVLGSPLEHIAQIGKIVVQSYAVTSRS